MRKPRVGSMTVCFSLGLVFLAGTLAVEGRAQAEEQLPWGDYQIGPGDDLHIVVWRNEELTMTVPVRPDGWISLPLVNDVQVAGLTPMQVREKLTEELGTHVSAPLVSVIVARVGSNKASILGNVRRPGRYDLESRTSVLDALALAGGPDEFANKSEIFVLRSEGDRYRQIPFDYTKALVPNSEGFNVLLKPGDIVIVP